MATAFLSARRSNDPEHKTGACVVNDDNKIVSIGYKGLPQNFGPDEISTDDPELDSQHWYVCHAAMNAVLNKNQENVHGCRMYCTHLPCNECAKIIIQSGIRRIVYANEPPTDCVKAQAAKILFSLVGVSLVRFRHEHVVTINLQVDESLCRVCFFESAPLTQ